MVGWIGVVEWDVDYVFCLKVKFDLFKMGLGRLGVGLVLGLGRFGF